METGRRVLCAVAVMLFGVHRSCIMGALILDISRVYWGGNTVYIRVYQSILGPYYIVHQEYIGAVIHNTSRVYILGPKYIL